MKRVLSPILLLSLLFAVLAGCGGGEVSAKPVNEIYDEIASKVTLPEMLNLNSADLLDYTGIDASLYAESSANIPVAATLGDMIFIFKANDEAALSELEQKIGNYRSQKLSEMQNYIPAEYSKINASTITKKGLYIWLVVSDDSQAILEVINDNIK